MPRSNSSLRRHPRKLRPVDKLTRSMLAKLPAVAAKTMAPAAAAIARLKRMAEYPGTKDIDFLKAVQKAARDFPKLFGQLDIPELERFIYNHSSEAYRAGHVENRKQFTEAIAK